MQGRYQTIVLAPEVNSQCRGKDFFSTLEAYTIPYTKEEPKYSWWLSKILWSETPEDTFERSGVFEKVICLLCEVMPGSTAHTSD